MCNLNELKPLSSICEHSKGKMLYLDKDENLYFYSKYYNENNIINLGKLSEFKLDINIQRQCRCGNMLLSKICNSQIYYVCKICGRVYNYDIRSGNLFIFPDDIAFGNYYRNRCVLGIKEFIYDNCNFLEKIIYNDSRIEII